MRDAQGFEQRLKILLSLHKIARAVQHQGTVLADDEFEKLLFSCDRLSARRVFSDLTKQLEHIKISPLPEIAKEGFGHTIELRNFLAHQYFLYHGALIADPTAREHLITLLKSYSEIFCGWLCVLDKWIDMLLSALGITAEEIESSEELARQFQDEHRDTLMNDLMQSVRTLAM
jgi:hypothetical protein